MCFFKQKTAYEMRISDWSSDMCSSDLAVRERLAATGEDLWSTAESAYRTARDRIEGMLAETSPPAAEAPAPRAPAPGVPLTDRSEARRVWTECVCTCNSRCSPFT